MDVGAPSLDPPRVRVAVSVTLMLARARANPVVIDTKATGGSPGGRRYFARLSSTGSGASLVIDLAPSKMRTRTQGVGAPARCTTPDESGTTGRGGSPGALPSPLLVSRLSGPPTRKSDYSSSSSFAASCVSSRLGSAEALAI